jgi:hypothetical protein
MTSAKLSRCINPSVLAHTDALAAAFARREPFRHLVIDDFLDTGFAARLLEQFPAFERGNARNEAGDLGGKSTIERIRALGDAYTELDDLIRTRAFLDFVGAITGIADLRYDPHYFGGGTHENRDGQDSIRTSTSTAIRSNPGIGGSTSSSTSTANGKTPGAVRSNCIPIRVRPAIAPRSSRRCTTVA